MSKLLVAVLIGVCLAGRLPGRGPGVQAVDPLTGIWAVQMVPTPRDEKAGHRAEPVSGVIALVPDTERRYTWIALEGATHFGVYVIDTTIVAPPASPVAPYPMAAARMLDDSAVVFVLNPSQAHQSVELTGTLRDDSVTGRWVESSYGTATSGTFTMRRRAP